MPNRIVYPLTWLEFKTFIQRVDTLAQEPGEEHLYRVLIFAGVVAHYGFHTDEVLSMRWGDIGSGGKRGITITGVPITTDCGEFTFQLNDEFVDIVHRAFSLAFPEHEATYLSTNAPILQRRLVPMLRSDGTVAITHKSLNQLLKATAEKVGYNAERMSAMVFRKTCARHNFDLNGQTADALSFVKQTFKCKSLAVTQRFIALQGEKGLPPVS